MRNREVDGDVFGDTMNVCARLVTLANPEQILTSGQTGGIPITIPGVGPVLAWDMTTGEPRQAPAGPRARPARMAARHPSRPMLALVDGEFTQGGHLLTWNLFFVNRRQWLHAAKMG